MIRTKKILRFTKPSKTKVTDDLGIFNKVIKVPDYHTPFRQEPKKIVMHNTSMQVTRERWEDHAGWTA